MRKLLSLLFVTLSFTGAYAQTDDAKEAPEKPATQQKQPRCSKLYFDISTGINNNGGLVGVGADIHLSSDFSINAGVGTRTTWGYKGYIGGKAYFKPCHRGWALGGGVTVSTGIPHYSSELTTTAGKETVEVNCLPQVNLFGAAYHHWNLGKNKNRMYLQLGYSRAVTTEKFRQISGNPLTTGSAAGLRILAPGGLIIGFGFSLAG